MEAGVHLYEIRILKSDGVSEYIIEMMNAGDLSAVKAARKLAGARAFEVWRDLECLHGAWMPHRRPRPSTKHSELGVSLG
jgi:hypothetical protein